MPKIILHSPSSRIADLIYFLLVVEAESTREEVFLRLMKEAQLADVDQVRFAPCTSFM